MLSLSIAYFIISGVILNLQCTICALFFGFLFASFISWIKIFKIRFLSAFFKLYVSIFRGTPLLLQLYVVYYILPHTGYKPSVLAAAIITFSLNSAAYVSEILLAGIHSIDQEQWDAARSLGLSNNQTLRLVILPQALRNVLPALINEIIDLLKESSLISVIGGFDILKRAQQITNSSYNYEPLILVAITYYVMILLITQLINYIKKSRGSLSAQ